ncbi:2497_t:CDS:10 [Racocetra fulgida]|uniref:2497_t:CDS:1 n=1 Tax=Racocetra fulgida TaxID=60492 RepID=A0A9N9B4T2_9GLOM|nr:2497_t:CDS:10 [Racocetra fulgida]
MCYLVDFDDDKNCVPQVTVLFPQQFSPDDSVVSPDDDGANQQECVPQVTVLFPQMMMVLIVDFNDNDETRMCSPDDDGGANQQEYDSVVFPDDDDANCVPQMMMVLIVDFDDNDETKMCFPDDDGGANQQECDSVVSQMMMVLIVNFDYDDKTRMCSQDDGGANVDFDFDNENKNVFPDDDEQECVSPDDDANRVPQVTVLFPQVTVLFPQVTVLFLQRCFPDDSIVSPDDDGANRGLQQRREQECDSSEDGANCVLQVTVLFPQVTVLFPRMCSPDDGANRRLPLRLRQREQECVPQMMVLIVSPDNSVVSSDDDEQECVSSDDDANRVPQMTHGSGCAPGSQSQGRRFESNGDETVPGHD